MDAGLPIAFSRERNEQLATEITQHAGHINAATHHFLKLLAEFDTRLGWSDWATQSCAHWLNWRCGIAMRAAREKVRVARALEKLPKISASMAKGELSYSKVRELTRVATDATEEVLLMTARHGTAHHVETLVRHFRRAQDAEELSREAIQQANRSLSYHFDDDGSLVLKARLTAEVAALFLKALDVAVQELPVEEVVDEQSRQKGPAGPPDLRPPHRSRRADALALMTESFLQHGAEQMAGGDKHQIVVHVAAETLQHKEAGCCEFEDGASMAAETARRLACDCSIVRITEDEEGEPLNVGRKTRSIPPAMKRALNSRDKGCRFPGCSNKKYIDGHHIHHWANGGETKLGNLLSLCRFHHHAVHEGGVHIHVLNDGAFRFVMPDGRSIGRYLPMSGDQQGLLSFLPVTSHQSLVTPAQWNGDTMDYGQGVQVLLQRRAREVMSDSADAQ